MKLGIIGCGLIGAKRTAAMPELTLVAAADVDYTRAQALCARYGGQSFDDAAGVFASDADIVVIAVTHNQLAPLALEAIRAGKHVLLEKPGARTAGELADVAALAKEKNLKIKVGFNHRFHPAIWKAKELVDQGAVGEILFVRGRYGHGGRPGYDKEWRFSKSLSGGGELLDQGTHLIDLSRWFLGEFTEVRGVLPRYFWRGEVEDNCFLTLLTAKGQCAHLHASWTEWKNMFCLEIYGKDGKLQIDGLGGSYGLEQLAFYKMLPGMGPPETTIWQYPFPDSSWALEMHELVDAIQNDRQPVGDIADAIANLTVVDALYAQGASA
ncbi:Oxidoreductase domain protein [uncultured delta proteobacterium]|uniref:Oxidoreductase domain protein n=1 Tax=uncultured delta proteobacterium TaxID=34034 RepID=A0A212KH81_9DELT|nr:Oxidoreductase domain protein [uncultured delta proteobacterium]